MLYCSIYFHCKPIFSTKQHGFLKGKSTTTNLTEFISFTLNSLENKNEVDVIATDFSKAFDKISHKIISFKLKALGFPPGFVQWIESYLLDRKYQVLFKSSISESFIAKSGVPQGSHLGPIIFILTINDVESVIDYSELLTYADDMKIFRVISAPNDALLLQNDLNNFYIWCKKNNLELNVNKCQAITYSRKRIRPLQRDYFLNNCLVPRVTTIRDLGVICDSELNFRSHYDNIVGRANSALGFVKRWSKEFSDPYVTKSLYTTFVRPLLEYASQVWSPYHQIHIKRIEAIQRRFLRFALRGLPWVDNFNLPPYQDRLRLINLQSLEKRREVADIIFVHQIMSGVTESSTLLEAMSLNINSHSLRSVPQFHQAPHRTDYGRNEPVTRMLREVNVYSNIFDYNHSKVTQKKNLYGSLSPFN